MYAASDVYVLCCVYVVVNVATICFVPYCVVALYIYY
jgi:hypothetical protein